MLQRYRAAMVLSGSGDAIGFKRGRWEFCRNGQDIHDELAKMGGIENIDVSEKLDTGGIKWIVSDDTVMHLATAEALVKSGNSTDLEKIYYNIGKKYKKCMKDMEGRAPGPTCIGGVERWVVSKTSRKVLPFNERGGGCGAAMRAMCIGLRYPRQEDEDYLIKISVESGRMTHHHPTGYLGSLAAALFTAYSIRGKPIEGWGAALMETLPKVKDYVEKAGHSVEQNMNFWEARKSFVEFWKNYLEHRKIKDGKSEPVFPSNYGVEERDKFYTSVSFSGWGGSSGHDAPLIAYDSLLAAKNNWKELANRAFFHGGDSDSTGVMAACWYGALYGFENVPPTNYKGLEYESRLEKAGEKLYALAHPNPVK